MSFVLFNAEWVKKNKERDRIGLPYLTPEEADEIIRDEWLEQKKYNELTGYILENWTAGNCETFMQPLLNKLIDERESKRYIKLWKGILRQRINYVWDNNIFEKTDVLVAQIEAIDLSDFNPFSYSEPTHRKLAYHRRYTMEGIDTFIAGLELMGFDQEIERAMLLRETVRTLRQPRPAPVTDKRKIDEALFWQLIEESNEGTDESAHFLDTLRTRLEAFQARELKNFDKILRIKANELATWNHWALAHIVRRGCGDEEFDYFKAWVVSRGKAIFEAVKILDESKIGSYFTEDPQLEDLYSLAANIYEQRTSDIYDPPHVKYRQPAGKRWSEQSICAQYPSLCTLFDYDQ